MKFNQATMALLGIAAGTELTGQLLEEKINEKVTGLQGQVEALQVDAAIGAQTLKETRERAVTLYKAAKGEKAVETFITGVIDKADLATAKAFCQEYQQAVDDAMPLKCPKCGEALSRRSSQEGGESFNPSKPGKRASDYKL